MKDSASSADFRSGAKPPSCDVGGVPGVVQRLLERLEHLRAHARRVGGGAGFDRHDHVNSWMSIGLSAWAPPLMMFIIGTGKVRA